MDTAQSIVWIPTVALGIHNNIMTKIDANHTSLGISTMFLQTITHRLLSN
jgi:hypothetical protein